MLTDAKLPAVDKIELMDVVDRYRRKIKNCRAGIDRTDSSGVRKSLRDDIRDLKLEFIMALPQYRDWDVRASLLMAAIQGTIQL